MTIPTLVALRVVRRFDVSAERVFDAWLDPKKAGRWLFATAGGQMVRVEIDARIGGRFLFVDRRNGEDVEHTGEYLELERPKRLVFNFLVPRYSAISTRVAIDIAPIGSGCEVTLVQEGVPPEYQAATENGWTTILNMLAMSV
jgi:uncharacterized protein YndB with AHSA1/START domain